jgi:hypothetical protein
LSRYNRKLGVVQAPFGEEAVGTGMEFMQARLTIGELGNCVDAVNRGRP